MVHCQECYDDGNEFCIDQNDILSVDLLPGSVLFMDQYAGENMSRSSDDPLIDGSFVQAYGEMGYHRQRMNEYLCHGYVAEEIFNAVGPIRVKRKNNYLVDHSMPEFLGDSNVTVHDKLLSDEGSSKYKDWLHKTTTLDDVYRHYAPHKTFSKKFEVHEDPEPDGEIAEFEGELTGFAMPASISTTKIGNPPPSSDDYLMSSGTGYGYPSYGPPPSHQRHPQEYMHPVHEHIYLPSHEVVDEYEEHHVSSKGKGHELSLKDFFEIALTALAFLAFGLFKIQLLMYITQKPMQMMTTTQAPMMEQPPEMEGRIRESRTPGEPNSSDINELAQRIILSIEAALVAPDDSGNCLRRYLCENNRYSRNRDDKQRIWMPLWGLGMSWASGRLLNHNRWSAMLESLKASVLGLGNVDCAYIYPDCKLHEERLKRKRRRRKR
ncbi:hypothetical protein QAD02_004647 [Eretmocerus hayati]|uniref:Uncharacterized protein n=1 Tax=Eretmocerus hayati TaxID=131215 RepID=A0ACC2NQB7_9HYME|nr:hypothetical protein QAD02_004647 [Eretmocerus hayati]